MYCTEKRAGSDSKEGYGVLLTAGRLGGESSFGQGSGVGVRVGVEHRCEGVGGATWMDGTSALYPPALAGMLLPFPHLEPLAKQEALASGRGAGGGAVGPGGCVLVAGRRDLDGRQLEVIL